MIIIATQKQHKSKKGKIIMSKKVTLNKQDLSEVLGATAKFFGKKNTLPVLDTYKINVTPTKFTVTVSNIASSIERSIPIMGFDTFEVCVDKGILGFVQKCPAGDITLEFMDYGKLLIQANKVKFETQTLDAETYPNLPQTKDIANIRMVASELEEMLKCVEFAAAEETSTNKVLSAINFSIKNGKLSLSALDGYRVAVQKREINSEVEVNINIPPISKYIKSMDSQEEIKVSWDTSHIILESEDSKVICRLIDGNYVDVERLMKCDAAVEVEMNKTEFLDSLERASLIAKSNTSKTPVILDLSESVMIIQMEEAKGKFEELIDMKKEGRNLRIGFNVSLLIDALSKITDKTVKLLFSGAKSPLMIKSEDVTKQDDYSYLVLPVNIGNK